MTKAWTDDVARYLLNDRFCPRCGARLTTPEWCAGCSADLSGGDAVNVRGASRDAVDALERRQQFIERIPTLVRAPVAASTIPVPPPAAGPAVATSAAPDARSSVSVQSVLAVAGAALVAVAAIVFTFLNPDLTDFTTRSLIVAAITVVFLGSAWLLVRAGLQFSAEAVGALGMVFVVLDIWAFSTWDFSHSAPQSSGWVFAGIGTAVASGVMVLIAWLARIRTWLWAGLLGLTIVPALFAYAADNPWVTIVGHLAVGFAALAVHDAARALAPRFGSTLRVERVTATVVELIVAAVVLVSAAMLPRPAQLDPLGVSGVLLALAVLAATSTRHQLPRLWSLLAGAFLAIAFANAPSSIAHLDPTWLLALVPAAAAVAVGLAAVLPSLASMRRLPLQIGAWGVALLVTGPALLQVVARVVTPLRHPDGSYLFGADAETVLAAFLGVAAAAAASGLLWVFGRRHAQTATLSRGALPTALWLGMLALLALADWNALVPTARVGLGLTLALGLALAMARIPRVTAAPLRIRVPLLVGAHLLLISGAALAWTDSNLMVAGGAMSVVVLATIARAFPAVIRPLYLAVGYAYALIVFAAGLNLVHVETIAVLCLTTTLGSLIALAATLIHRLPARSWYAVLIVTAVPFLIGIGSVLTVRSGWTALSTGVTFLLALTLVVTRRPGLNRVVRAMAAALLVPSLAVVVVCLGAQFLTVSGSPVALPIIAVIVACMLPSTGLVRAALERRGIPIEHAAAARTWIEISTWVTGALSVVLALGRAAAGLGTSCLVLLIIGLGAAAMALFAKRRYGWALAFASWTGALWCVWALAGIVVAEPYILPPALVAAIIGAVLVARGRPGIGLPAIGLFSTALAAAIVPSLAIFAVVGDGRDDSQLWRGIALVAASLVLLTLAALVRNIPALSHPSGLARLALLARLRVPLLIVAITAAAAGPAQAVRWGLRLDPSPLSDPLMWPVLAVSAGSALIAAIAGRLLLGGARSGAAGVGASGRGGRWAYAPAAVFLAIGPIAAVRAEAVPILVLYVLGFAYLALMLVTVLRARTRVVTLPPVWFTFVLAWCLMVASWSTRELLRVEAYSLPLGLALLAAGVILTRHETVPVSAGLTSWPVGFRGSWRLLAPGIVVTLLPSILATGTDPQTIRAILVLGLALVAILIGSLRRLGAPFIIGLIVLPIENIVVFAVQVGRSIGATPWWITLATAGAVLLVIAVTSERRSAGQKGMAARLRDLR
ncbi:MAG: hypothetical protein ABIO06_07190 [Pseudolysinimonas sp.]